MRLSVVIPALNEERHLGQLLSDIQRQTQSPDEVIVVDAGSTDATVHIAKRSQAVVLHGEPPIARGRNLGGYSATGELIFLPRRRHPTTRNLLRGLRARRRTPRSGPGLSALPAP